MDVIKKIFTDNGIRVKVYTSNPELQLESFPDKISWIYELLLYVPFYEQSKREEFIEKLPIKLIEVLGRKFKDDEDIILKWLTKNPKTISEKYYTSILSELIEERFISINKDGKLLSDLDYFKNECLKYIKSKKKLNDFYITNNSNYNIPKEFEYYKPLLLMIKKDQNVRDFLKNTPKDILELNSRMMIMSKDYINEQLKKYNKNKTLKDNMELLIEAADEHFGNSFSFEGMF